MNQMYPAQPGAFGPGGGVQVPFVPPYMMNLNSLPVLNDKNTLFVGNLDPNVTNSYLFQMFSFYGHVTSCRVMRNIYNGESREYAFVSFKEEAEAQRAFEELNGHVVFKREMRVMFKRKIKDLDNEANVVVKNISSQVNRRQLFEECRKFGNVLSIVVFGEKADSNATRVGYVQFESAEDAQRFAAEFDGRELCEHRITVERYIPPSERAPPEVKNVYIKLFPATWDKARVEEFLEKEFRSVGPVTSHGVYGTDSFYAFVAYERAEDAKNAIERFNGWKESAEGPEEGLYVVPALSRKQRMKALANQKYKKNETNLYVRSILPHVTLDEFKEAFSRFGKVTSAVLKKWESTQVSEATAEKRLQYGFVNFENSDDALQAHSRSRTDPEVRALVDPAETYDIVCFAQPKRIRDQYLRTKMIARTTMNLMRMAQSYADIMQSAGQQNSGRGRGQPPRQHHRAPRAPTAPAFAQIKTLAPPTAPIPAPIVKQPPQTLEERLKAERNREKFIEIAQKNKAELIGYTQEMLNAIMGPMMYRCVAETLELPQVASSQGFRKLVPTKEKHAKVLAKVTGMLIDPEVMELDELLETIGDPNDLEERVMEAINIIVESS